MVNVIPGGKALAYQGRASNAPLALHRWLFGSSDNLVGRIAKHVYLKRDGAEKEPMGAGDGTFRFRLQLVGDSIASDYQAIAQYLRDNPRGTLTHPLLGSIKVAADGIDEGSMDLSVATNVVNLSLRFSEDAVDTAIALAATLSPSEASSSLATQAGKLSAVGARISSVAALASTVASKAEQMVSLADTIIRTGGYGVALSKYVDGVDTSSRALEEGIKDASGYANDADRFDDIESCRLVISAARQLNEAIQSITPRVVPFVVQATTTLYSVAVTLYGKDAAARLPALLQLNRVPNPLAIPAGTVLQVPAPTV